MIDYLVNYENKKAPTFAEVEATSENKNSIDNNSISRNKKKYTKKDKLEKNSNNEVVEVIEKSCVKIRKEDLKDCISEFTDINKLKEALAICEINNNHGIKSLRMAYKYGDIKNNSGSKKGTLKGASSGVNNTFKKYTEEELNEILKANEKRKEIERKQKELKESKENENIDIEAYAEKSIIDFEYFKGLNDRYKAMVIEYINKNKSFKPIWIE
jgi:hypothetical protein